MISHYRAAAGSVIFDFVRSFARCEKKFLAPRTYFDDAKISEKKVWVDVSDSVQESSKSELSSRFLSRSKFRNVACHYLANSGERPRIYANLIMIRSNPGTIGRIREKVACSFLVIGPQEMSCLEHKRCSP